MTYGDRTGNKPQNTSPQLNANNINHTDTTQHIIIHNSSYMMAPPYGSDPTTRTSTGCIYPIYEVVWGAAPEN